jgi:hypothetical protein
MLLIHTHTFASMHTHTHSCKRKGNLLSLCLSLQLSCHWGSYYFCSILNLCMLLRDCMLGIILRNGMIQLKFHLFSIMMNKFCWWCALKADSKETRGKIHHLIKASYPNLDCNTVEKDNVKRIVVRYLTRQGKDIMLWVMSFVCQLLSWQDIGLVYLSYILIFIRHKMSEVHKMKKKKQGN